MPFDLRDIPLDQKAEAALAARGLAYRVVDPDDRPGLEAWVEADRRGFNEGRAGAAELARELSVIADRRALAVYDPTLDAPEIPVATAASWPSGLSVPGGRSVDAWAVGSVTVAPTHRRRGIARAMMEAELRNARAAGAALAMLTASEATLYGRYGYAPAARAATVEVERRRVEWITPAEPGRVQFVAPDVMRPAAAAIARRAVARTPGEIDRWPGLLDRVLGTHDPDSERSRAIRVARYDDRHDQPQGFVAFRMRNEPGAHEVVLEFDFLAAATDEAERALWRFLTEHDLVSKVRGRLRSVDEPLPWLIADRRAIHVGEVTDHLWLRILDPVAALEARRYSGAGSLVLEVDDPLGYATGRYELEFSAKGQAEVRRVEGADPSTPVARRSRSAQQGLRLGVAELGAIYLGDVSPTLLARAGRIVETTPGSLAIADRLFSSPRTPHLSIWF